MIIKQFKLKMSHIFVAGGPKDLSATWMKTLDDTA